MIPLGVLASSHVAPVAPAAGLTYIGTTSVLLSSATETLTDVSIGPASASRTVLVVASVDGANTAGTRELSNLTSTGGTLVTDVAITAAAPTPLRISRAPMPTGTTADFTVTASTAGVYFLLSVYVIDAALTLTDSDLDLAPTASDSLTLDTIPGGFVLAGVGARYGTQGGLVTSFSTDVDNQSVRHGHQAVAGSSTSITVANLSLSNSSGRFVAAAYAPM